ncbi:MAG: Major Facilitator Superfamily protein [Methanomassiliicoccales archaeon PtaU1.Bin124]|nr:MAG: Major Facilitator Superfamily protein [Methanomassiliicoccales archaeon PtaU1.Bin124]
MIGINASAENHDMRLLFISKAIRMFAYGFLSIVLVLYLVSIGMNDLEIGALLALTLLGDTAVSLYLTTHADSFGRRRTLIIGAALMLLAGVMFVLTNNFLLLLIAAIIGVISPSGNEVGPFLSVEQSALAQLVPGQERTRLFAWYNLLGSFSTASGALVGGWAVQAMLNVGMTATASYQWVIVAYAALGIVLGLVFIMLTGRIETAVRERKGRFGLHHSKRTVAKLSALFSMDAFGGGLIVQSVMAYWFFLRFGTDPGMLGTIFFAANLLSGFSALVAAPLAKRIGLIPTMVYTHLPSNILLIMVPLMPSFELALAVLLLRFSISQMDVPTRQAYVVSVVHPDERSAASGITGVARTMGQSVALMLTGFLLGSASDLSWAFIIAGSIKIVYDLLVYYNFKAVRPLESGVK